MGLTARERRAIAGAVRQHLGAEVRSAAELSGRSGRQVYLVRLADREVVLKVLNVRKARSIGCTFAVESLREAGVPTPRVLAADSSGRYGRGTFFDYSFVILERAEGVPMDRWILEARPAQAERDAVLRDLGRKLRRVHSVTTPRGYGPINDQGVGRHDSWTGHLCRAQVRQLSGRRVGVLATDGLVEKGVLSSRQAETVAAAFADGGRIPGRPEPRLLHNDLTLKNVLVDPERRAVSAILDLHNALAGDPVLELARFRYFYRGRGYEGPLQAGYGVAPDELEARLPLYLVFVLLEKIAWLAGREDQFPGRRQADLRLLVETVAGLSTAG